MHGTWLVMRLQEPDVAVADQSIAADLVRLVGGEAEGGAAGDVELGTCSGALEWSAEIERKESECWNC